MSITKFDFVEFGHGTISGFALRPVVLPIRVRLYRWGPRSGPPVASRKARFLRRYEGLTGQLASAKPHGNQLAFFPLASTSHLFKTFM